LYSLKLGPNGVIAKRNQLRQKNEQEYEIGNFVTEPTFSEAKTRDSLLVEEFSLRGIG